MIRIAVCDNQKISSRYLENMFEKMKDVINFDYDFFETGKRLLEYINKNEVCYHIYVLETKINNENGIEIATDIRKYSPYSTIIFLTQYSEYVYDAFKVNAYDYIIKPINYEKLLQLIYDLEKIWKVKKDVFLFSFAKTEYAISFSDIAYFQKMGKSIYIHELNGKHQYRVNMTIKELWTRLNKDDFISIHSSYVVNMSCVQSICGSHLVLKNDEILEITRTKKTEVMKKYKAYLRG